MTYKIVLPISFIIYGCTHAPTTKEVLENFVEKTKVNRSVGSIGHENAFNIIKSKFDELALRGGGNVRIHTFTPDVEFAVDNYKRDFDTLIKTKYKSSDPVYKKWESFTKLSIDFVRKYKSVKGKNLILELPGDRADSEVVWVGAHYDTITHNHETMEFTPDAVAPGADDNARILQEKKH